VTDPKPPSLWSATFAAQPSVAHWESQRRARLLHAFASHVYGRTPEGGGLGDVTVHTRKHEALAGGATRIEADLTLVGPRGTRTAALLVYLPAGASPAAPVPALLGLNFAGNHTTTAEPDVRLPAAAGQIWAARGFARRGAEARRWPYVQILDRGYAVATLWYEEIEIDLPGFATAGIRGVFGEPRRDDPEGWGAIGAWAWGLSRAREALGQLAEVDDSAIVAVGHSRLGKTALWAAAQDPYFAGVVSNESGCGGASLFRHRGVEDIGVLTAARPHWFAGRLNDYRGADERLPVDQHQLLALAAPRPVHVASASRDPGADPYGEFLSTLYASPIFELYGHQGTLPPGSATPGRDVPPALATAVPAPVAGTRIGGRLSYHLRDGEHDMLAEDWLHILDFADENLR
jgi:hypothetical protein